MKFRFEHAAGTLAGLVLAAGLLPARAGGLQPQGEEFTLTRGQPGDQVNPAAVLRPGGGILVWQDAGIDGNGIGIAALRLSETGAATVGQRFQVNEVAAGDQENPAALAVGNQGTFVVWQGGAQGFQRIVGRVLRADGSPLTGDLAISTGGGEHQIDPSLTLLTDGTVLVAWASFRQDEGFAYDAYARRFSADGTPLGDEFRLNASRGMGRRSPAVAALPEGGFLAAWVSERQSGTRNATDAKGRVIAGAGAPRFEVNVVTRAFQSDGAAVGAESVVSEEGIAAHPVLASLGGGRVLAAWTRRDPVSSTSRLDIAARVVGPAGVPEGAEFLVNNTVFGDQYRPRLAVTARGVFAVWSSMGQDGSWEGVFGRWINAAGEPVGDDILVNSQRGGAQIMPTVVADAAGDLLVAWSSNLPRTGFDVFAQRFSPLLLKVRPEGRSALKLQWPTVAGGVYQVQASRDGTTWSSVGGTRTAAGTEDTQQLSTSGQMLLYRVVRVR